MNGTKTVRWWNDKISKVALVHKMREMAAQMGSDQVEQKGMSDHDGKKEEMKWNTMK